MIASHFAEPLARRVINDAPLRDGPCEDSDTIRQMSAGEPFDLLDSTLGWAWGYAGADRRVGYVRVDAIGA